MEDKHHMRWPQGCYLPPHWILELLQFQKDLFTNSLLSTSNTWAAHILIYCIFIWIAFIHILFGDWVLSSIILMLHLSIGGGLRVLWLDSCSHVRQEETGLLELSAFHHICRVHARHLNAARNLWHSSCNLSMKVSHAIYQVYQRLNPATLQTVQHITIHP